MFREHIHAIAHLHAAPDKAAELEALLTSLLEPTREEPGCVRFELLHNREAPAEFAVVSEWQDEQAVQHHVGTVYAQRAMNSLPDLLANPLDLRFYRLLG